MRQGDQAEELPPTLADHTTDAGDPSQAAAGVPDQAPLPSEQARAAPGPEPAGSGGRGAAAAHALMAGAPMLTDVLGDDDNDSVRAHSPMRAQV